MSNEEIALAIQSGDNFLLQQLWEQCKGFIRKEACRWARAFENRPDIDADDLTQSGYFALLDAVQRFDPARGNFISVLAMTLKTAFTDACGVHTQQQRQDPLIKSPLCLDSPALGNDDLTFGDTIPDPSNCYEDVEEKLYQEYVSKTCREAVDSLSNRQREVINLYFYRGRTQKDIASQQGISFQRVQQIIVDGLRHIRNSSFFPELEKIYYSSCNYYRGVGTSAFKRSNTSSVERELLRKERKERRFREAVQKISRDKKISLLIQYFGYSYDFAEWMVDNDSDRDYSKLLLMERIESA